MAAASLLMLAACTDSTDDPAAKAAACAADATAIAAIQGDGWTSPLEGQRVTVTGVITHVADDGLYLQSLNPDERPETSEALFIAGTRLARAAQTGRQVAATGQVNELFETRDTLTALTGVNELRDCGLETELPVDDATLPLTAQQREAQEGMRLAVRQFMAVTDVYSLGQGRIRVSRDGILPSATEVARPGDDARAQARLNRERSLHLQLPPGEWAVFPIGTTVQSLLGVLGHDGREQRLLLNDQPTFVPPPLFEVPEPDSGTARIVSLNLHNYFNGDGRGGGFPTSRGAETEAEFVEQRRRLRAALTRLQPQIVAVMELENDGFGPASAAADFIEDLKTAIPGDWKAVESEPGMTGTDEITVGLFYLAGPIRAMGEPMTLHTGAFEYGNRVPLSQVFGDGRRRARWLVTVNHLKSKGSCPESGPDANQRDGQGCWNASRKRAANQMIGWVRGLAQTYTAGQALVLGDMNAYRMEDPIQAILDQGFADLTAPSGMSHSYTYLYFGESGTLDYAFATPELARNVDRAQVFNINAGWPRSRQLEPDWLGSSDHDPVVVDIRLRQSPTSP